MVYLNTKLIIITFKDNYVVEEVILYRYQQKVTFRFTRIIWILIQIIRKMHEIQIQPAGSRISHCVLRASIVN